LRLSSALALTSLLLATAVCADDGEVVATVGGEKITRGELEKSLAADLERLDRERHLLLEQGLQPLIERRVLQSEADRRGVAVEELLRTELQSRMQTVTDEQAKTFFEANSSRINGPYEQVLPEIKNYLAQQAAASARSSLIADLSAEHKVVVHFEPLRVELGLEDATLKGPEQAAVTIVEFSDFQCPACRSFNPILSQVVEAYGDQVQVAFRQFPLRSIHPQAQPAAEAALCAREQGKFWQLHDAMFADQRSLNPPQLKALALTVGLDGDAFDACLDEGRHRQLIDQDLERGERAGVTGTPSVFINGREVSPGRVPSFEQLQAVIDDELRRANQR
jgi:protein-disulfide isomerase